MGCMYLHACTHKDTVAELAPVVDLPPTKTIYCLLPHFCVIFWGLISHNLHIWCFFNWWVPIKPNSFSPVISRADSSILMDSCTFLIVLAQRGSSVTQASLWQPLCSHETSTRCLLGTVCYKNLHTSMCLDHTSICDWDEKIPDLPNLVGAQTKSTFSFNWMHLFFIPKLRGEEGSILSSCVINTQEAYLYPTVFASKLLLESVVKCSSQDLKEHTLIEP